MAYVEPMSVAELISVRIDLGWTQLGLAEQLGIHHTNVAQWERGRRKVPAAKAAMIREIHGRVQALRAAQRVLGPDPAKTLAPPPPRAVPPSTTARDWIIRIAVASLTLALGCFYWVWSGWSDFEWLEVLELLGAGLCSFSVGCSSISVIMRSRDALPGNA
jgi:transcriptional regulator with XRE-family HTH domain